MPEVNLLAVSVGNTRTRIGGFVDGRLAETATFVNERNGKITDAIDHAYAPLRERESAAVLLSSVNPSVAEEVAAALAAHLGHEVLRVERDVPIPIGRQLDPEAMVGEDRLLNAAAAYGVLKQAAVVVDAGTAITVDFVDGAGTFHGGAIAPGGQLMMDSLNQRTAALPEVEFGRPDGAIGHNTHAAMRAGAYYGLRGLVRELVERMAEELGQFPMVVATGGDGALLFKDDEMIDRVVPDLTLMGLELTQRVALERAGGAGGQGA
ncbi:MAG: type III pantothenate kinase [Planctomycetota bacterium]